MPAELVFPLSTVWSFLLVVARIGGAISFLPLPGLRQAVAPVRAWLTISLAIALRPAWPPSSTMPQSIWSFALVILSEAALGIAIGVALLLLNEAFVLASQIFGLQAGYGYAATIDPTTEADTSVLQILTHLVAGLMFFAMGLDRQIVRAFAWSLQTLPPGTPVSPSLDGFSMVKQLGTVMFSTAVRMALPVVAILVLIDLALALLGRINAQLQLISLAFPAKMLVSMVVLAATAGLLPVLYRDAATTAFRWVRLWLGASG